MSPTPTFILILTVCKFTQTDNICLLLRSRLWGGHFLDKAFLPVEHTSQVKLQLLDDFQDEFRSWNSKRAD